MVSPFVILSFTQIHPCKGSLEESFSPWESLQDRGVYDLGFLSNMIRCCFCLIAFKIEKGMGKTIYSCYIVCDNSNSFHIIFWLHSGLFTRVFRRGCFFLKLISVSQSAITSALFRENKCEPLRSTTFVPPLLFH